MADKEYTDDDLITCLCCGSSTPHETAVGECCWRELRLRLAASNALCAELAEALEGIIKHPPCSDPDCCSTAIANARATDRGAAALAKFKEATR